jgi:hypothetical protein
MSCKIAEGSSFDHAAYDERIVRIFATWINSDGYRGKGDEVNIHDSIAFATHEEPESLRVETVSRSTDRYKPIRLNLERARILRDALDQFISDCEGDKAIEQFVADREADKEAAQLIAGRETTGTITPDPRIGA